MTRVRVIRVLEYSYPDQATYERDQHAWSVPANGVRRHGPTRTGVYIRSATTLVETMPEIQPTRPMEPPLAAPLLADVPTEDEFVRQVIEHQDGPSVSRRERRLDKVHGPALDDASDLGAHPRTRRDNRCRAIVVRQDPLREVREPCGFELIPPMVGHPPSVCPNADAHLAADESDSSTEGAPS
jgi:hypothetical protein